jgi:hypothetical protein
MTKFILLSLLLSTFFIKAQFPAAAGQLGTTAIYKDSTVIVNWATACKVTRGWQDISNTSLGKTTAGDSAMAIGHADASIVSLGDSGSAILTFQSPIKNGNGFDFCVYENSFSDNFLELAFVEVSSDGINFIRFPATSNTPTLTQIGPFDLIGVANKLNNLAGKYRGNYGTPFDLQELQGIQGLDINNITHIKIIDVVGNINAPYATYDKNNNAVNDPWPTAFASGGFDLDAVGVIHQLPVGVKEYVDSKNLITVFPNPFQNAIYLNSNSVLITDMKISNELGIIIYNQKFKDFQITIDTKNLLPGIYMLEIAMANGNRISKKIIKL